MGQLFVISAPSGAGKTSLVRALLERAPESRGLGFAHHAQSARRMKWRVATTTSSRRGSFSELVGQGAFLEHAQVFDNYYGTGRGAGARRSSRLGKDVLLEIDWQGARQVRRAMPDCTSIFILPPSRAALEQRLRERRTDSAETIARRLADASADMSHYAEFDFVVVNDRFRAGQAGAGRDPRRRRCGPARHASEAR